MTNALSPSKAVKTVTSLAALAIAGALGLACGGGDAASTSSEDITSGPPSDNGPQPPSIGDPSASSSSSGSSGNSCAATEAKPEKAKVDIVFVIDNSGSMNAEMNQIKANVNTFAGKIGGSGLDYRVVFIVAKASSPTQTGNVICVPAPLGGANCADNPGKFYHINQSVSSTNSLSLILSTYDSANAALNWKQHLRAESYKVFVEVTDDQSAMTSAAFDQQILAKAPAGMFGTAAARKYIFHTIAGWKEGTAPLSAEKCSTAENTGSRYQELSQLTGGIIDSVCKTDYSGVLDKLATGIVEKLGCELTVPSAAASDPASMVVQLTPQGGSPRNLTQVTDASKCAQFPESWYYDDNNAPSKILLCGGACTSAQNSATIKALVGCRAPAPK
jgi:hypothetical protein